MRSREEILEEIRGKSATFNSYGEKAILEVLLDIRDLLEEQKPVSFEVAYKTHLENWKKEVVEDLNSVRPKPQY